MTHPTPPKQHSCGLNHETVMVIKADEALAYTEARAKQARLDALEEVKVFVKRQQDFRKTVPDNSKRLNDDGELLQETMDEIDKLKEGV